MGFDNECIINIQSLAGEYFCPVCRLLVYPNEALQSQCTHLYCKPCLAYVVGTTRACPYDGYLVTEADSKPLVESNKVLADTIGKLAVHCLYHRSGCTWQGPLSDCISHCSSCTFGNSPVVCNRCSIQIVHRQVQEHAQSCPGVPSQVQQPTTVQDVVPIGSSAPPPDSNQTVQTGATSHIPHGPTLGPIADVTQHSGPVPAQPIAQASAPTPEQWYQQQQQYQQYYQQYPGYDPYQQQYQQYYPYQQQQQPSQQYPLPQQIIQPQQSSVPPQMYSQQHQSQNQPPMQPQPQFPAQILPQPPLQPHQPMQTPFPPQNQKPAPVIHPHSHTQFPPQTQPYPQILPQPVQHPQTQPPPQPQFPQNYPGIQQQPQYPPQQQPQPRPLSQQNQQQPIPNSQPLVQHPSALAVTGNQSYPQPHIQQLQQGGVQPHHGNMQVQSGSFPKPQHPSSIPVQVSQPSPQVRPQQQSALFPSMGQAQIPPAYLQMQQPNHPSQQRPTIQSGQQLQAQFLQQNPQNLSGQPPNMPLNQPQQQHQPIIRPQGPSHTYSQSQQDSLLPGLQHQQLPPNQAGVQSYPHVQSVHPPPGAPVRPIQPGVAQNTVNQNYAPRNNHLPPASEQHIGYIQPDSQLDPPSTIKPPPIHDMQRNAVPTKGLPEDEADQSLKKSSMKHEVDKITPQSVSNDAVNAVSSSNVMRDSVQVQHSEADINVDEKVSSYKPNNQIEKLDHAAVDHVLEDKEKLTEFQRKDSSSAKHDFIDANGKIQIEKPDGGLNTVQNEKETAVADAPVSETGKNLAVPARDIPQIKDRNIAEANSSSFQGESYRGFHSSADMQARGTPQPSHQHRAEMGPNNSHMVRPNLSQQQRPVAPFIPQQTFPPGNPSQMHEFLPPPPPPPPLFPQGPGMVPLQGPPLASEVLPQPSMNQPHGFLPEVPPGGMMGMPYSGQYGPAPNQYGPGERNIDPQLTATHSHGNFGQPNLGGKVPQGEYGVNPGVGAPVPGSFDPSMGMFPLRGPQNNIPHYRPNIPTESEIFSGQRPNLIDSRPPSVHAFGGSDHGPFDPRHMMQPPNLAKMNGFRGLDSPSALGIQNDRFNPPMENVNPFMVEPNGRAPDRRIFEEDLKLFPRYPESSRHGDGGNASLRTFDRDHKGFHDEKPPFPIGGLHYPNDGGERIHHAGFHDDGRHRVDPRSPNRELSGIHSRGFGGFSAPSMNRIGRSDMDGRDSKPFSDIQKPFDLPPDHPGVIFGDNRYPPFSNVPHRGDLDIPTNFTHHRNIDAIGQDLIPDHRHNISNQHHRFGDSSKFSTFPSMGHSQDEPGSGNFSQMPFGDSIRTGNMPSHPRIGEPGFRSRYSLPAFPKDGGFNHGGDIDPLDNMRKRTQRVGWCRICKVDCETVEGLDLHSQTGEHQKTAMDMVINIKLQNSKKMKTSNDSKVMNVGHDIRNN